MNSTIANLNVKKLKVASENAAIEMQLQAEYNKVFKDSQEIKELIAQLEQSNKYTLDEYGEIESFVRVRLNDYTDCSQYLAEYLSDCHCIQVDFDNQVLTSSQGESITIQDDSRRKTDNGIWLNSKQIINETAYLDDDNEVDEVKRNELIEAYMERTGYFPGVFRVDYYGNVSLVNTNKNSQK